MHVDVGFRHYVKIRKIEDVVFRFCSSKELQSLARALLISGTARRQRVVAGGGKAAFRDASLDVERSTGWRLAAEYRDERGEHS